MLRDKNTKGMLIQIIRKESREVTRSTNGFQDNTIKIRAVKRPENTKCFLTLDSMISVRRKHFNIDNVYA